METEQRGGGLYRSELKYRQNIKSKLARGKEALSSMFFNFAFAPTRGLCCSTDGLHGLSPDTRAAQNAQPFKLSLSTKYAEQSLTTQGVNLGERAAPACLPPLLTLLPPPKSDMGEGNGAKEKYGESSQLHTSGGGAAAEKEAVPGRPLEKGDWHLAHSPGH